MCRGSCLHNTLPAASARADDNRSRTVEECRMPMFESKQLIARPVAEVFDFLIRPANLIRLIPQEFQLTLLEGPERLELGSTYKVRGRRWGLPHRAASEVTVFESNVCFVEEQRQGPFRRWLHAHHFESAEGGTLLTDRIEFEPPGGILGLTVNAASVLRDLERVAAYRRERLKEVL